nr:EscU/YscU/HrcU family type III secretion system export apparatus switch protein [uncultured Eisenbergiella sp.]
MSKYKKNKAAALKYNMEEDTAPVVIASGYGPMAEKIIDIAEQKGIPVFKDDSAASLLCMLDVGTNIPVELYEVVAAIYGKLMEASAKSRGNASPDKAGTAAGPKTPHSSLRDGLVSAGKKETVIDSTENE